jgi:hypothetical protein
MLKKVLILAGGVVVVLVAFALVLSIIDRGFAFTLQSILLYINP